MPRLHAANNAATVLASDISSSATSLTVVDGSRFPTPPFRCTIFKDEPENGEIIEVGAKNGNTFSNILRAQEGTTSSAWDAGDRVELLGTAGMYEELVSTDELNTALASKSDVGHTHTTSDITNITISSSDPAGGNDGDIWFRYIE